MNILHSSYSVEPLQWTMQESRATLGSSRMRLADVGLDAQVPYAMVNYRMYIYSGIFVQPLRDDIEVHL